MSNLWWNSTLIFRLFRLTLAWLHSRTHKPNKKKRDIIDQPQVCPFLSALKLICNQSLQGFIIAEDFQVDQLPVLRNGFGKVMCLWAKTNRWQMDSHPSISGIGLDPSSFPPRVFNNGSMAIHTVDTLQKWFIFVAGYQILIIPP